MDRYANTWPSRYRGQCPGLAAEQIEKSGALQFGALTIQQLWEFGGISER